MVFIVSLYIIYQEQNKCQTYKCYLIRLYVKIIHEL